MTTETTYSLAQLAQILSALDNERRNPNTKRNAIKAIERAAAQIGLTAADVFDAADGLLSGRLDAAAFRDALTADAPAGMAEADEPAEGTSEPAEAYIMPNAGPLAEQPKARYGTKQATLIEMLSRPEGATVEQLAAATGWQNHTVRGAIAGALKKKLGLTVTTERVRGGDGQRGAYTIYRIQPTKYRVQA